MITFGYKNKFSGLIRALLAIAVGVVMVASKTNALELAVRIIAAFLVATGIVTMVIAFKTKKGGEMNLMGVNAGVDILLGMLLFFFPGAVVNLLIYIIGFILLAFGIMQIVSLVSAVKVYNVGVGSFVMPVIVLIAGGFLLARPSFVGQSIGIIAGVSLILYGVSELISAWKMRKAIEEYEVTQQPQTDADAEVDEQKVDGQNIEDVEYKKVDEQ